MPTYDRTIAHVEGQSIAGYVAARVTCWDVQGAPGQQSWQADFYHENSLDGPADWFSNRDRGALVDELARRGWDVAALG